MALPAFAQANFQSAAWRLDQRPKTTIILTEVIMHDMHADGRTAELRTRINQIIEAEPTYLESIAKRYANWLNWERPEDQQISVSQFLVAWYEFAAGTGPAFFPGLDDQLFINDQYCPHCLAVLEPQFTASRNWSCDHCARQFEQANALTHPERDAAYAARTVCLNCGNFHSTQECPEIKATMNKPYKACWCCGVLQDKGVCDECQSEVDARLVAKGLK